MSEITLTGPNTCYHNKQLQLRPLETPEIVVVVLRFLNEIGDLGRTLVVCKLWNRATILSQRLISSQLLDLQDLCAGKVLEKSKPIQMEEKIFLLPDLMSTRRVLNQLKKDAVGALAEMEEEDFKNLECSHGKIIDPTLFNNTRLFAIFKKSIRTVLNTEFNTFYDSEKDTLVISTKGEVFDYPTMSEWIADCKTIEIFSQDTLFDLAKVYQLLHETNPGFLEALVQIFTLIDDLKLEEAIELLKANAILHDSFKVLYPVMSGILVYTRGVDQAAAFINSLPENRMGVYLESAKWIFQFSAYRDQAIELINTLPSEHDRYSLFVNMLKNVDFTEAEAHRGKIEMILQGLQIEQHLNQQFHAQEFDRLWKKEQLRQAKVRAEWDAQLCTLF
jgi:hypothetical protein